MTETAMVHRGRVWRFVYGTGEARWVAACECSWRATAGAWAEAVGVLSQHRREVEAVEAS